MQRGLKGSILAPKSVLLMFMLQEKHHAGCWVPEIESRAPGALLGNAQAASIPGSS